MGGINQLLCAGGAAGNAPVSTVTLSSFDLIDVVADPADAAVTYKLDNNGNAYSTNSTSTTLLQAWCTPDANAGLYEVYMQPVTGAVSSGTTNTWLALSSDQTWELDLTTVGQAFASFTVGIRLVGGDGTILAQTTIYLECEVAS